MTRDRDEDAFRWDGDADPSYVPVTAPTSVSAVVEPVSPVVEPGPPAVEPGSPVVESAETPAAKPATGSFLLVSYGILAGAYLIYTIGWLVPIVSNPRAANPDTLGEFMVRLAQVLAIAAPAIWYGATMLLTRGRRSIVTLLFLLAGLVVLLPWPYLLLGV